MQNPPSSNGSKWFILLAIGIGTFMSALDGSVVNTILPVVRVSLGSDLAAIQWVVVVYLLAVSGLLLTLGRLGDLRGHRVVYLSGFVIFITGSALCGQAQTAGALIGFRALQALGAAALFSNSPAILTSAFPSVQRGQALGIQATMTYLGLTAGPSLGGWLAQAVSWRAVFNINVPVGLIALGLAYRFVPRDRHDHGEERFDIPGALLFTAGLVALLLGLNQGSNWGWSSLPILALLAGALILLAAFVLFESRVRWPMLDLTLFRNRTFTAAAVSAVCNYMGMYMVLFLLPFYLIQARGFTSAQAGLILTAQPVIMAIVAPISGTSSDRIGSRLPATLGMLIMAGGFILLSSLRPTTPILHICVGLAVCGLGSGMFASPNNSSLMGAAPRNRQGIASGMLAMARNVGMVLGVGLSGAILTSFASADAAQGIYQAMRPGFLIGAGIALVAAVASALRQRLLPVMKPDERN
ncbi:MAG TPA: MFS transporter [Anaerolineaceae bacterium]